MPRDGSGNYALPNGNPVVPNTVISSGGWAIPTLNDIASAITQSLSKDGQTVPTANLPMGNFRHTGVANAASRTDYAAAGQVQDSTLQWLTSVAGTDAITANVVPAITAYVAGQAFRFVSAGLNTAQSVTLNINGLGAKAITRGGGTNLYPGDIPAGVVVTVVYDGTFFQINGVAFPSAVAGGSPFPWRNRLMNALGNVNQRGYVSGTATTGANQYTLDRWRVVTSGQNFQFLAAANGWQMFAPAGGVEQVIEGVNIEGGTYYLNWIGTATATVNGSAITKGIGFALAANTNATVRFTNGSFYQPQLEIGGVTPFEQRPYGEELALCKRYCAVLSAAVGGVGTPFSSGNCFSTTQALVYIPLQVTMRAQPAVSFSNSGADFNLINATGSVVGITGASAFGFGTDGLAMNVSVAAGLVAGNATMLTAANSNARITATAEL